MGKIVVRQAEDVAFMSVRNAVAYGSLDEGGGMTGDSLDTQEIRILIEGGEDEPALIEVRCGADKPTVPHAHPVGEIVYVLEGELIIGNRRCGAGSAIYVPEHTLYAFKVGNHGVRYLNMRPRRDNTYISKNAFLERRRASTDPDGFAEEPEA